MATMFNAVGKAPGVYIQEINVPGPIAGVATSTAAFVGPARRGDVFTPTFLTNWTQFLNAFGSTDASDPAGTYIDGFYAAHAVRGFFDNGGTHCYFVRVSTAAKAWIELDDRLAAGAQKTLRVTAKAEGLNGNTLKVEVKEAQLVAGVKVARSAADMPLASAPTNLAVLANAVDVKNFRPGDLVHFEEGANTEEIAIASINVTAKTLTLVTGVTKPFTAGAKMRLASMAALQTRVRLEDVTGIEPGSYVTLEQGAIKEAGIVSKVDQTNGTITLSKGLTNAFDLSPGGAGDVTVKSYEFTLLVTPAPSVANPAPTAEAYANLSLDPRHSRYFAAVVDSPTVVLSRPATPSTANPPDNLPVKAAAQAFAHGAEDDLNALQAQHFKNGIDALLTKTDVNLLCVPDRTDQDVQAYMITHCELLQDRFAILDPQRNAVPFDGIETQRRGLTSLSGYAALYYPWISISNPSAILGPKVPPQLVVPPSGHIAGVYSRVDDARGVHKAPANESIRGALALERELSDNDQGTLNDLGINVIRRFPDIGILIWGARTLAPASRTQWRYLNVRRLVIYLEKSIQIGTQFAVFEPNDLSLRKRIERMVSEFLTRIWRSGALFGATAAEAFRVRADEELNPPDVRALGQLIVEVVVVPTVPAEFVVFQIIQDPTGASLTEQ